MPSLGVIFEIRRVQTLPGETVRVCGSHKELGCWDPRNGADSAEADVLRLRTGALSYPRWSTSAPVWINYEENAKEVGCSQAFHLNMDTLSTMDTLDDMVSVQSLDAESNNSFTPPTVRSQPGSPAPGAWNAGEVSAVKGRSVELEYKFLRDMRQMMGDNEGFQWEEKIKNRRVSLPQEAGSMWLVSDALWDSEKPPRVTRIDEEDVFSRRAELDPNHVEHKVSKGKPAYPVEADCVHSLTPGTVTPKGSGEASFDIEGEFDALANRKLPELLAERLAAMQSVGEMAEELMELRRECSVAGSQKEQLEEEVKALHGEATQLKTALREMSEVVEGAEEASKEHLGEIHGLREENAELQEMNALLATQIEEFRLLLSNTRAELVASQDAVTEHEVEAEHLRLENARLTQERAELRLEVPKLQSQLKEVKAALHAAQEEVAELSFSSEPSGMNRQQSLPLPQLARQFSSTVCEPQGAKGGALKAEHGYLPKVARATQDARPRATTDTKTMILQARSSLSSAPQVAQGKREDGEEESELMKALRRRRAALEEY